jgi:hypothetical protein
MKKIVAVISLVVAACAFGRSGDTASAIVRQNPQLSLLWKTVASPQPEIMLDWPRGAARVEVSVDGVVETNVTDVALSCVTLSVDLPDSPADERIVMLAAEYFDADGNTLRKDEAELALVCGVGGTPVFCRSSGNFAWHRAGAKSAVLPLPDDAVALSVNGETVQNLPAAPGWYWLNPIPSSPAELSLALEDGTGYENSVRGLAGLMIHLK